jgi:putative DNA primase/helicase
MLDPDTAVIHELTPHALRVWLTEHAEFRRHDGRAGKFIQKDCPKDLAQAILEQGYWEDVPLLKGITTLPILRADGSLHAQPGYDHLTGLFYLQQRPIQISSNPTIDDARQAMDRLNRLFADFDFVALEDRSVALSLLLSLLARPLCLTIPMHVFSAPTPGSGKTLLVRIVSNIVTGTEPALHGYSRSEEERKKALFSLALHGVKLICLDNIPNGEVINSPTLAFTITAPVVSDRRLGRTETIQIPNTSVIAVTGNNIRTSEDLVRRSVCCRLDPHCERPELRYFESDPIALVKAAPASYIADGFTVLAAYLRAGAPKQTASLGSFEDWSRVVRGALVWVGMPDPCLTQQLTAAQDDNIHQLSRLLNALHTLFHGSPFKAKDVFDALQIKQACSPETATLLDVIAEIFGPLPPSAQALGKYFSKYRDRIAGGMQLIEAGEHSHTKVTLWKVKHA